jgi:hypothetical protein
MWKQHIATTKFSGYQPYQFLERENVRSNSVDNTVFFRLPNLYHQVRHVLNIHLLELVGARPKDRKDGEVPE